MAAKMSPEDDPVGVLADLVAHLTSDPEFDSLIAELRTLYERDGIDDAASLAYRDALYALLQENGAAAWSARPPSAPAPQSGPANHAGSHS